MNIQMRVMDDMKSIKEIKNQIIKTPLIALPANAINGEKEKITKEGLNEYLSNHLI
tara:strand:+ start:1475 stop:1642 length:168 start_codon:yes stop_codon:yes gene_type:complete